MTSETLGGGRKAPPLQAVVSRGEGSPLGPRGQPSRRVAAWAPSCEPGGLSLLRGPLEQSSSPQRTHSGSLTYSLGRRTRVRQCEGPEKRYPLYLLSLSTGYLPRSYPLLSLSTLSTGSLLPGFPPRVTDRNLSKAPLAQAEARAFSPSSPI